MTNPGLINPGLLCNGFLNISFPYCIYDNAPLRKNSEMILWLGIMRDKCVHIKRAIIQAMPTCKGRSLSPKLIEIFYVRPLISFISPFQTSTCKYFSCHQLCSDISMDIARSTLLKKKTENALDTFLFQISVKYRRTLVTFLINLFHK